MGEHALGLQGRPCEVGDEPALAANGAQLGSDDGEVHVGYTAGLCEWTNAQFAARFGLRQFLVRGLERTTCVALLAAITSNLIQHLATLDS